MASYLDQYGAGEERRNKMIVRAVLGFLGLVIVATGAYFYLRNAKEQGRLSEFRALLEKKDYQAAYRHWGCTPEKPCKYYPFEKFLRDWGEKSGHTDFGSMQVVRKVTCKDGYGNGWKFGDDTVHVWVVREDLTLGFDPWPNWKQTWLAGLFNDCSGLNRTLPDTRPL
jgi:hypothetical protein